MGQRPRQGAGAPKNEFPWFWGWDEKTEDFTGAGKEPDGNRWNDCHYTNKFKRKARKRENHARQCSDDGVLRRSALARSRKQVPKGITAEEMIRAAELDWQVELRPARGAKEINGKGEYSRYEVVRVPRPNTKEAEVLLGVVSRRYQPLQNLEAFGFFDPIVGEKKAYFETAGALGEGRAHLGNGQNARGHGDRAAATNASSTCCCRTPIQATAR